MSVPAISYGPDGPSEGDVRLCGDVAGKRVIQLGVGKGDDVAALATAGARTIGVDPSAERLAAARRACAVNDLRVELRQGDLADLGFATSASVDLVLSIDALVEIDDLHRVLRQVHRVLRPGAAFVVSVPHPFAAMLDPSSDEPLLVRRSYWARGPVKTPDGRELHHHGVGALFTAMTRSDFSVDALLEPEPSGSPKRLVPTRLIVRGRKLGV
jgi:SAM-dependent methyltransferase